MVGFNEKLHNDKNAKTWKKKHRKGNKK